MTPPTQSAQNTNSIIDRFGPKRQIFVLGRSLVEHFVELVDVDEQPAASVEAVGAVGHFGEWRSACRRRVWTV